MASAQSAGAFLIYLNNMSLKRFGVSVEDNLLNSLDNYVKENSFSNRSRAISFLIEKNIAEEKWQCDHIVAGAATVLYDRDRTDIAEKISEIELRYSHCILSSSLYYLNDTCCLHVATVMGAAHQLTELSDKLSAIKGIRHGKLVMSRAE